VQANRTNVVKIVLPNAAPPEGDLYPSLNQKAWDRLPTIFKEIIEWDRINPLLKKIVDFRIKDSDEYVGWKASRDSMRIGAENFITKQKGGRG
jgi:hypothetical protein